MLRTLGYGVGALVLCVTGPALAQQATGTHPRLAPSRDVTVLYSVQPEKLPKAEQVTVSFSADGNKLRIDSADGAGTTVLDRPGQQVTLIMNRQKLYTSFAPQHGLRNPFMLDVSMQFTPDGTSTVAGLACNRWAITTSHGKAEACVTEDGVILSESGVDADGQRGTLEARKVTYAPLPAAHFQPPEGYQKIDAHAHIPHLGTGPQGSAPVGAKP